MKPHSVRAWRALHRKTEPARLCELDALDLLAGLMGGPQQARAVLDAVDGDLLRLPDVLPYLDTLPGIGAGTAFRLMAALEIGARVAEAAA